MPKTPCKAFRKDGQPCQGHGQEKLGGYCIAHGPPDIVWGWRSKGGQASSAAARADKRLPDRLRGPIEMLNQGMDDLAAGESKPAVLTALSRAANVLAILYRLANSEMDLIRAEEDAVAAALVAGGFGDQDLLDKAEAIAARQNQYRIDSLVLQGIVTLQRDENQDAAEPLVPVLTPAGRQRFRYQRLSTYAQSDIDRFKDLARDTEIGGEQLSSVLIELHEVRVTLKELLTDHAPDAPPALDPLSGQPLSRLPDGVKPATVPVAGPEESEQAAQNLQALLRQAQELTPEAEDLYEKQFGCPFDIQEELAKEDSD